MNWEGIILPASFGVAALLTPQVFFTLIFYYFTMLPVSQGYWRDFLRAAVFALISMLFVFVNVALMDILGHQLILAFYDIYFWIGTLIKIIIGIGLVGGLDDHMHKPAWKYFMILILSLYMSLVVFNGAGPILGTVMVESSGAIYLSFLFFCLGILAGVLALLGIGLRFYPKMLDKPWTGKLRKLLGILIFFSVFISIGYYFFGRYLN